MKKVFIDSNVFIIHLRYKRDKNFEINRKFLDLVLNDRIKGYTSIYNLLEMTGILSFNLNKKQIEEFFINFPNVFNVGIIFPENMETDSICVSVEKILELISKKMSFMDAVILDVFQSSKIRTFITWNAKDFKGKTKKQVLTPEEFLKQI
ncbi:type II toxin-antitoxin system VapC family toxin [Persephonella sp.]